MDTNTTTCIHPLNLISPTHNFVFILLSLSSLYFGLTIVQTNPFFLFLKFESVLVRIIITNIIIPISNWCS